MSDTSTISYTGDILLSPIAEEFLYKIQPILNDGFGGFITLERMWHLISVEIATFENVVAEEHENSEDIESIKDKNEDLESDLDEAKEEIKKMNVRLERMSKNADEADLVAQHWMNEYNELLSKIPDASKYLEN